MNRMHSNPARPRRAPWMLARGWLGILLVLLGGAGPAAAARLNLEYEIDGLQRRVLAFVPDIEPAAGGDAVHPLVVVYHGRGDDSAAFAKAVKLHEQWPEAIVAYPRGELHDGKSMRGWQYRPGQYADRDLKLTDRLLEDMAARYGTRPAHSYAAGFSNGGHFVFLLMAERSASFAAFGVLGAVQPDYTATAPPRPLIYLFGRGEDKRHQNAWQKTIEALIRHQRTSGPLQAVLGCCQLQAPTAGGAPLVFGVYNAGHTWPQGGNQWLRAFFTDPQFRAAMPEPAGR